jgi:hypothetical protein
MAQFMIHELAGISAQDRYSRRGPFNSCCNVDGCGDLQAFEKHWMEHSILVDGRCSDCDEFQTVADQMVRHFWSAIVGFARVLLDRETLEHDELEKALALVTEGCERFPLFDFLYIGLEPGPLPFGRYVELEAAASQIASSFQSPISA